ncbi:hypothetical protein CVT24_010249 [Panaeolus cyanescens]|uniref:Uncharacterized protein n=1 Tax=Panaeolus cyanescens TaxID=181874 RepID=A0A409WM51_9AGAR|nr:hypothetical protein CVT24_010249 [Panaeolus cyanescens]
MLVRGVEYENFSMEDAIEITLNEIREEEERMKAAAASASASDSQENGDARAASNADAKTPIEDSADAKASDVNAK